MCLCFFFLFSKLTCGTFKHYNRKPTVCRLQIFLNAEIDMIIWMNAAFNNTIIVEVFIFYYELAAFTSWKGIGDIFFYHSKDAMAKGMTSGGCLLPLFWNKLPQTSTKILFLILKQKKNWMAEHYFGLLWNHFTIFH